MVTAPCRSHAVTNGAYPATSSNYVNLTAEVAAHELGHLLGLQHADSLGPLGINPATQFWLWASIVLYLASLAYLLVRQRPRVLRLLRGERSTELTKELRRATIGLVAVIAVIGAMMVFKPGR